MTDVEQWAVTVEPQQVALLVDCEQEYAVTHEPAAEVQLVLAGDQGPPGPPGQPGGAVIAGYEVDVQALTAGDVLVFKGTAWGNEGKFKLTDGGNF